MGRTKGRNGRTKRRTENIGEYSPIFPFLPGRTGENISLIMEKDTYFLINGCRLLGDMQRVVLELLVPLLLELKEKIGQLVFVLLDFVAKLLIFLLVVLNERSLECDLELEVVEFGDFSWFLLLRHT
jgi:hypothetical protein